jgi:hypothetical protein
MPLPPEPQRILQYFAWEDQQRWQKTTAGQRLEWLEFIITMAWAGAAHRQADKMDPPPTTAGDDIG